MKPYPQKGLTEDKSIYNYRHSRVRRLSENLFGILSNRWRVFTSAIMLSPEKIRNTGHGNSCSAHLFAQYNIKKLLLPSGTS